MDTLNLKELSENDPIAEQPSDINITLKRHQLTLLAKARNLEQEKQINQDTVSIDLSYITTKIGVLCDQPGSGKSYVLLSLVQDDRPPIDTPNVLSYGQGLIIKSSVDYTPVINTNLLVIPHNLINQWTSYVQTFNPNLEVFFISRMAHIHKLKELNITSYRLLVVTCSYYNDLCKYIDGMSYMLRRVFYDEVDSMNIPACNQIKAAFYWFVTASYGNLIYPRGHHKYDSNERRYISIATGLHNSGFIKNIFYELTHKFKSSDSLIRLFIKNTSEYVQESLQLPPLIINKIQCVNKAIIDVLSGIVDNNIMGYLNVNDIKSAIQYINPKCTNEDNIINTLISKSQKQLENLNLRLEYTNLMNYETPEEKEEDIKKIKEKIEYENKKIEAIKLRIKESDICAICYDEIQNKTVTTCCSNSCCFKCLNIW
jgi:hypothetical protein